MENPESAGAGRLARVAARATAAASATILAALVGATPAAACSCAPPNRAATLPSISDVFVAEPIGAPRPVSTAFPQGGAGRRSPAILGGGSVAYEMNVIETLKGQTSGRISLLTPSDSASCGSTFEVGQRYLIFARRTAKGLKTGICEFNVEGDRQEIAEAASSVRRLLGAATR